MYLKKTLLSNIMTKQSFWYSECFSYYIIEPSKDESYKKFVIILFIVLLVLLFIALYVSLGFLLVLSGFILFLRSSLNCETRRTKRKTKNTLKKHPLEVY